MLIRNLGTKYQIKCLWHLMSKPISTGSYLSSSKHTFDDSDEKMKKVFKELNEIEDSKLYAEYHQDGYGIIYDKKPFKYPCIEGKAYFWCSCGHSHKQVSKSNRNTFKIQHFIF